MQPSSDAFRQAVGHFATGVTVMTTLDDQRTHGITVNALSSVSLDPPTGLPLLTGAIATLECTTVDVVSAGDHDLFIARVDALANDDRHPPPLLYDRRRYLRIERARSVDLEGKPDH